MENFHQPNPTLRERLNGTITGLVFTIGGTGAAAAYWGTLQGRLGNGYSNELMDSDAFGKVAFGYGPWIVVAGLVAGVIYDFIRYTKND